jgi:Cu+-exporting ATPase
MVEAPAARPRSESGRAPQCPACGKSVDPLRAGHVAILGDEFHYYCDDVCKRNHVRGLRSGVVEAPTADPPPVVAVPISAPRTRDEPPSGPVPSPVSTQAGEPEADSAESAASEPQSEEDGPLTLRSPAPPASGPRPIPAPDVAPQSAPLTRRRTLDAVGLAGSFAGVLAAGIALVGVGADPARLPLAALGAAAVVARAALMRRDATEVHPAVSVGPVVLSFVAALWARVVGAPHALAIASFGGLAAAASLAFDLLFDRARENVAAARARIRRALDVQVRVVRGERSTVVPAEDVKPGEPILLEAGDVAGVDAIVAAGEAVVLPWLDARIEVHKKEGDSLVAGARIVSGRLRATTTWAGDERAWAKLALAREWRADVAAPIARSMRLAVERAAPVGALLAAIAGIVGNGSGPEILAAACGVAIALSSRGAVGVVALHHARGQLEALLHGIVYRDAGSFDQAGRSDVAVLCSRGTVLTGEPEIVALEALGSVDVGGVLAYAAGAETPSAHPFAAAILRMARTRGERIDNVRSATMHAGLGVTALASSGERLVVGSRALLLEERVSVAIADSRVTELEAQGRSVLLVALAGKPIGLLALQDGLRPGARAAVQRLLDKRLEPVLLSGEARGTCETIGRALDIEHIRPEVLPADRGAEIKALRDGGHVVAVLGHAATDDAALGAADVSIAMDAAGGTPGEWSVALASDDVRDAARAVALAHDTRDRAKIAIALGATPGLIAALLLAFGGAPLALMPIAAFLGALGALAHAKQ